MSLKLNPNCTLPCRNYIFHFDGRVWSCVASTTGDAIGLLFSEFCDLLDIVFPDRASYMFLRDDNREIKIRQYGNDISLYINPLKSSL